MPARINIASGEDVVIDLPAEEFSLLAEEEELYWIEAMQYIMGYETEELC